MRKFNRHQPRSLRFRLLVILAGALLLAGAFVPRTHAAPIVYWNFDDSGPLVVNMVSDPPGAQTTTLIGFGVNPYVAPPDLRSDTPGLDQNSITGPSVRGMGLASSGQHTPAEFRFALPNPGIFTGMTLSFAINSAGNGFTNASVAFSTTGINGTFTIFATAPIPSGGVLVLSAPVPVGANLQPNLAFSIILSGGQSNGNDLQNVVDNILIDGTIVPEPATMATGLLGVLGLCWFQRRRLIGALRLRRT